MAKLLVIDDDDAFCAYISLCTGSLGHECDSAGTLQDGIKKADGGKYDLIFLDLFLPDAYGLDGIDDLQKVSSSPEIIIVTASGDAKGPETALKKGAWHYLEKPPSSATLELQIKRALQFRGKKLQPSQKVILNRQSIIGDDPRFTHCLELVSRAAGNDSANVFITGETGVGKELFAKAIHENSDRKKHHFITVDCTNIPKTIAESLLFGHIKGAFTDADRDMEGLLAQADNGTLFFDEIGDLDIAVQKSLLRLLQYKTFRPLGSKQEISCDVRIISATNKNLVKMAAEQSFREDLYYRINGFQIDVPPLRERGDDVVLLINHYLYKLCHDLDIDLKGLSKEFTDSLKRYEWPGNVRELINVLNTSITNALDEPVLYFYHLPMDFRIKLIQKNVGGKKSEDTISIDDAGAASKTNADTHHHFPELSEIVRMAEIEYLDKIIDMSKGDLTTACRLSGLPRASLYKKLKKHGKRLKDGK